MYKSDITTYKSMIDVGTIGSINNVNNINTNIQNKSYSFNDYNVILSYNSSNTIHIEIVFNTNYTTYTTTIRTDDLTNQILDLDGFFNMVIKSFDSKYKLDSNYKVDIELNNDFLLLSFTVSFDNLFVIKEVFRLDEKIVSDDKLLNNKLNDIENKYTNEIKSLKDEIKSLKTEICELKNTEIILGTTDKFGKFISAKPNIEVLDFTTFDVWRLNLYNYLDLNKLKLLEKIIIYNHQFCCSIMPNLSIIHNSRGGKSFVNFLDTFEIYLPSVVELVIIFKGNNDCITNLRSIPNLHTLTYQNYDNNLLNIDDLVKTVPKLKKLVLKSCSNVGNLVQIRTWTKEQGVELIIE